MNDRSRVFAVGLAFTAFLAAACERTEAIEDVPQGTDVVVETNSGQLVRGRLTQLEPDDVVVANAQNTSRARVSRRDISAVQSGETLARTPEPRMITLPARTMLAVTLNTTVASNLNHAEDPVRATLASPLLADGVTIAPAGSLLTGVVTAATPSGKVKGRAALGFRFTRLRADAVTYDVNVPVHVMADATKASDAGKVGIGAAAGALIGAIAGGKKGAAVGSAVGAGGGGAVVLATAGEEVQLDAGRRLDVVLADPLTVFVPADERASGGD